MHILENIDEADKRPEVAFLIPSESTITNAFNFSEYYWKSRQELMSEGYGVVIQQFQYEYQDLQTLPSIDTLIFDATRQSEDIYLWQLSRSNNDARIIWQIFINKEAIEGRCYKINYQGRLVGTEYIKDQVELRQLWSSFIEIINRDVTIEYENKKRKDKQLAIDNLLTFEHTRRMLVECPTFKNGVFEIEYRDLEVFNEKYKKQHERLLENVRRIGFTALQPFTLS